MSAFIVAEIGVNWDGDRSRIPGFIDAAKAAGASACKFQAFDAWKLAQRRGWNDREQIKHEYIETFKLLQRCELSDAALDAIAAHCKSIGFEWFASVFDTSQVERVLSRGACAIKIGHKESGDTVDRLHENSWAQSIATHSKCVVYASCEPGTWPRGDSVKHVLCQPEYPARSQPRLGLINAHKRGWEVIPFVGFSSHWPDYRIPAAAALRGAEYIEAHLKLSNDDYEAKWSLSVEDFGKMVKQIREFEQWL